jgi:uroporphyrinogen-III decarboxylase
VAIATDLVLQERTDPEAVRRDGRALAGVVREAAERYRTTLAVPLMDLRLEKADLVALVRPDARDAETFHFDGPPSESDVDRAGVAAPFLPLHQAHFDAIAATAARPGLVPLGMAIGPFSLATKLLADPITAVGLAGAGLGPEDDPAVASFEHCLALAELAVARSLREQLVAGAAAVIVCEPAAGSVYVSPRQMAAGSPVFERFVVDPLVRVRALLDEHGADLVLHDCGELATPMLEALAGRVRPAVLSLGSSRCLWQDAALVPTGVVLFGNLPSKHFYSDATLPVARVRAMTRELVSRMRQTGHPFILGSECDVLHVPGAAETIREKVLALLTAPA